jgi:hypothetical protein
MISLSVPGCDRRDREPPIRDIGPLSRGDIFNSSLAHSYRMKWVTREHAKVDRIACPWLIRRFVDPEAEFLFVPPDEVMPTAEREGAVPFDTPGAELTHWRVGAEEFVSFDAIIKRYAIEDPALLMLARIVRGADADIADPPPESAGLEHAAEGFRLVARDDIDNMRLQFPLYDALYEYCKQRVSGKDSGH